MTVTKTEDFCEFDCDVFNMNLRRAGFATINSKEDAHYYRNWASPTSRKIISYTEGDFYTTECTTDQEFVQEVNKIKDFMKRMDTYVGICCPQKTYSAWVSLGYEEEMI